MSEPVDVIDRAIITVLLDDGRVSLTDLASRVEQELASTGTVATDIVYDVGLEQPPGLTRP